MPQLTETTLWETSGTAKTGVFEDVKILGQKSKNNRFYTETAMRAAVSLYEGRPVYISHAADKVKHRPAPERYGRLANVRYDAQRKQLRGNLVYLESQAQMTAMVKEDIDRGLNFFGLSHVADGEFHMKEGVQVVTSIDRVTSVDLVSDPATATSLREQEDAPAPPGAAPVEAGPDHKVEALRGGIMAILDGGGSVEEMAAKITELLETMVKGEPKEGDKPKDGDKPAEPAQEQLAAMVSKLVEQALTAAKPKKYVTATPTASKPLTEQTVTPLDAPPKDKAALRKWLHN